LKELRKSACSGLTGEIAEGVLGICPQNLHNKITGEPWKKHIKE